MLRTKIFHLRVLATVLLAGSLFGTAMVSRVHATSATKDLANEVVPTNTPITPTVILPVDTPITPTVTLPVTTPTLTNTPSAPSHIVISEFRTSGPSGADDEFVELYNPTGAAVNMGGWQINKSSNCGTFTLTLVTIPSNTILEPGQHYLVAASGSNSSIPNADQTFSPGIADTGGLALVSSNTVIDQVGMCAGTFYHEGNFLQPLKGTSNQSYERKPGGDTACYDTTNNASDFALISPANPQNRNSIIVMCAGVTLSSPTPTPTPTLTGTPTRVPTAILSSVVLNEFLPHPHTDWNGDGTADTGDEYIEIINLNPAAISVKNWRLDTGIGSKAFTLPDTVLEPRQIAFFFGSQTGISIKDGGGTVRLLKPNGYIEDAYTYPVVEAADRTWCRLPDGTGVWGFACRPSPGRPNILLNSGSPGPSSGSAAGGTSICQMENSVPQSMILAECGSFGSGIVNDPGEKVFWLRSRWKWDVFVK
jgi:hypothetical protein